MIKKTLKHQLTKGQRLFCWTPIIATVKDLSGRTLVVGWGFYRGLFRFEKTEIEKKS